jgi:hypothetical protein
VSLLRNLPLLVSNKRQINIPSDICEKHGIIEEDVLRNGAAAKGLQDGLYEIGTRGMDELITARRELKGAGGRVEPRAATPVFLSAVSESSLCEAMMLIVCRFQRRDTSKGWKRSISTSSTSACTSTTGV